MQDDTEQEDTGGARSFWSGTVAFGLVSLPVSLYVANRSSGISLRMLDEDGTPLARRYFCTKDDQPLTRDDLVRGYEIEKDEFVEIADEELEALVPEKSREIDLRRFVPLADIEPMYFERAYFLVPDEGAIKAYRLLAASMESMGRAGIATFVMRGKEYLIAIIAENGILRAETLRFHDELRTPEDVGLPALQNADAREMNSLSQQIEALSADTISRSALKDASTQQLLDLVERKLESGEDVIEAPDAPEAEPESAEIIDLMQVLKQSLQANVRTDDQPPETAKGKSATPKRKAPTGQGSKAAPKSKSTAKRASSAKARKHPPEPEVDASASKTELYEMAKELHIPGRSQMSRDELLRAVQQRR